MRTKICFIYPWATLGGVERVLINRAKAFAASSLNIEMSVYFLHDSGGLKGFRATIEKEGLNDYCKVVNEMAGDYDFIIPIDSEEGIQIALKSASRILLECHTSYKENRNYLRKINPRCEAIIVPSEEFKSEITAELDKNIKRIHVLNNFIPWDLDLKNDDKSFSLPNWTGVPILYLGRIDELKNYRELLKAMQIAQKKQPNKFLPIFCGPVSHNIKIIQDLKNADLFGHSLYLPAVPFGSVTPLLKAVANKNGIFVSPSKAESFGLSAAEAISCGLPPLLSNIKPHIRLVKPHEKAFTYVLGDPKSLVDQLNWLVDNYNTSVSLTKELRSNFSSANFIKEWEKLILSLDNK